VIVLADNDLILKLAQCDLLKDLTQLLGADVGHQIFVSPTAPFQLLPKNPQKALNKAGNEATLIALRNFLAVTTELPPIQDESLLVSMEGITGIDSGEQLLFAAMAELEQSFLATGDRRALSAVTANQAAIPVVYDSLHDRVLTFETALLLALAEFGFPNVKQRLLGNPKPDGVLRLVLRDEMQEQELVECLVSYSRSMLPFLARKDRLAVYYA